MMPNILPRMVAIASIVLLLSIPASAEGPQKLSHDLAGKSIMCGVGPALFFDPDMRTATIVDSATGDFPIAETQTTIEPSRIKSDDNQQFEVSLRTQSGESQFKFARKDGISLYIDKDTDGDPCDVKSGRAEYIKDRFNMIRESVCGNDPKPSCEKGLAKACGAHPETACVKTFSSHHK